ncbi:MAG: DUF3127 domain-containing protein [Cytophagales bacterium]|nr:MAG: DUF3127 domain-containing protein [Cytophagales bacterium]
MANLEISGKLLLKLAEQSGEGKNGTWRKQDFVIETQEQYPKKVCFSAWGDKVKTLQDISIGEEVKVYFNVESREYNGKWYTDLKIWRLDILEGDTVNPPPTDGDLDSAFPTDGAGDTSDDLPF